MLNPASPLPLYHQLADILLAKIRGGEFPPGARIPSEHQLAAAYGIGRPTARQAVNLLVRKRLLRRRRGSGTYVRTPPREVDLFSLAGTTSAFHSKGLSVTSHIVKNICLKRIADDPTNPFRAGRAYYICRLSKVEGKPVLIEDMFLHPELFAGIDRIDLKGQSLARVVNEKFYMRPTGGKQSFRIGYADGQKAQQLEVLPSDPILEVQRTLNFPQARNALFAVLFCRTDQFVFSQLIGGIADDGSRLL